jgi:hypothetical protein
MPICRAVMVDRMVLLLSLGDGFVAERVELGTAAARPAPALWPPTAIRAGSMPRVAARSAVQVSAA